VVAETRKIGEPVYFEHTGLMYSRMQPSPAGEYVGAQVRCRSSLIVSHQSLALVPIPSPTDVVGVAWQVRGHVIDGPRFRLEVASTPPTDRVAKQMPQYRLRPADICTSRAVF